MADEIDLFGSFGRITSRWSRSKAAAASDAEYGDPDGDPVLWFHGTPGARKQIPPDVPASPPTAASG